MSDSCYDLNDLLYLMARLRDPETGCPWDLKQDFYSIIPHTLEEVYEVVDTIEQQDFAHLTDELGDLLFQIVFYCQLGKEADYFDISLVIHNITAKLLRRHPHVFPDGTLKSISTERLSEQQIKANWEVIKQQEREQKQAASKVKDHSYSLLADIPTALPALQRANKLQQRAATVGFDWTELEPVFDKVKEELLELQEEIEASHRDQARIQDELGDLLFSCVNLSRHLKIDPEQALRQASDKFTQRFHFVEQSIKFEKGGDAYQALVDASIEEMEAAWQRAKLSTHLPTGGL